MAVLDIRRTGIVSAIFQLYGGRAGLCTTKIGTVARAKRDGIVDLFHTTIQFLKTKYVIIDIHRALIVNKTINEKYKNECSND